ncbi:MAG: DNA adenine methylase [Thermoplasmatales archaeon]
MSYIKLIKYPGSKNNLISTINELFLKSGAVVLVDVFGGSGIVPLNIEASQVVYNDLNKDLYNLFNMIRLYPNLLLEVMNKWTRSKEEFVEYREVLNAKGMVNMTDIDRAFRTFYGFNVGFGGMGSTYRTQKEKSSYSQTLKVISNYGVISSRISKWKIENLDFREVFRRFDSLKTFFYCDPPYSGKNWYEYQFDQNDLEDLMKVITDIRGKYLLSFDESDQGVKDIFGVPDLVVELESKNKKKNEYEQPPIRRFSIYTNVA